MPVPLSDNELNVGGIERIMAVCLKATETEYIWLSALIDRQKYVMEYLIFAICVTHQFSQITFQELMRQNSMVQNDLCFLSIQELCINSNFLAKREPFESFSTKECQQLSQQVPIVDKSLLL